MENPVAQTIHGAIAQASLLAKGADQYGGTIPLGINTAANIRNDITALTNSIDAYGAAKDQLTTLGRIATEFTIEGRRYLMAARDSFKPQLGNRYNHNWDSTGLIGSLIVSQSQLEVLPLLGAFRNYLTGHPNLEVPGKNITILLTGELYSNLEDAIANVNLQETVVNNAIRARDAKVKKLRRRIRGTIATLTQELDPLDSRWAAFGLNQPGAKARPERPDKITITLQGNNAVVKWKRAARAEYYRVWKKVMGVDQEMLPVGSPADLDLSLENLPVGTTIEIAVSAVNSGGESILSELVTISPV